MPACKVPFAMNRHHFHIQCLMIMAKRGHKVLLFHKLAVWYDGPHKIQVSVVGEDEALNQIVWPTSGSLHYLLQNLLRAVTKPHLLFAVFDWYLKGSIKTQEHLRRAENTHCPDHNITLRINLPTCDYIMKNTHNNCQLVRMFCENADVRNMELHGDENCLFHLEEADCVIISHIKLLLNQQKKYKVVSDDADTFALLVHFCWKWQCEGQIYMHK